MEAQQTIASTTVHTRSAVAPGQRKLANDKHERFCHEYIRDFNGLRAAVKVGFNPRSAASQASRLLTRRNVAERVEWLKAEGWRKLHMSADELLASVARVARFDPAKLLDSEGNPLPLHQVDEDTRLALAGIDFEERVVRDKDGDDEAVIVSRIKKVRANDRGKAQEMLMRHAGLFELDQRNGADALADAFAGVMGKLVNQRSGLAPTDPKSLGQLPANPAVTGVVANQEKAK